MYYLPHVIWGYAPLSCKGHWQDAPLTLIFLSKACLREMNSSLSPRKNNVQQGSVKPTVNKCLGEGIQLEENRAKRSDKRLGEGFEQPWMTTERCLENLVVLEGKFFPLVKGSWLYACFVLYWIHYWKTTGLRRNQSQKHQTHSYHIIIIIIIIPFKN